MDKQILELECGYPLQLVTNETTSYKPIRNSEGSMRYKDALVYLTRVIPQRHPNFNTILSLAGYATSFTLTDKQALLADKFIHYWEQRGVL